MKYLAFVMCILIGSVTMTTSSFANQNVYIGPNSIICATKEAAMQIYASDKEYDGTVGNCIGTENAWSAIKLEGSCGFLNPICAYKIPGVGIVYAAESFFNLN